MKGPLPHSPHFHPKFYGTINTALTTTYLSLPSGPKIIHVFCLPLMFRCLMEPLCFQVHSVGNFCRVTPLKWHKDIFYFEILAEISMAQSIPFKFRLNSNLAISLVEVLMAVTSFDPIQTLRVTSAAPAMRKESDLSTFRGGGGIAVENELCTSASD